MPVFIVQALGLLPALISAGKSFADVWSYLGAVRAREETARAAGGVFTAADWDWLRGEAEKVNAQIQAS